MIPEALESHDIPLADCRAQDDDNGAIMSLKCNNAQAMIKNCSLLLFFSLCLPHT